MAGYNSFFSRLSCVALTLSLTVALASAESLLFRPHGSLLKSLSTIDVPTYDENFEKPSFCRSLDCPQYKVINTTKDYEVREYVATNWVSTNSVDISYSSASYTNFMRLFRYIGGNNVEEKKIAMTCPVLNRIIPGEGPACENNFTMSFFVAPSQAPAPSPKDNKVFLTSQPGQIVYVKSFGGFASKQDYLDAAVDLADKLPSSAKYYTDYWYTAGYDSPFQFLKRHNEVWFIGK